MFTLRQQRVLLLGVPLDDLEQELARGAAEHLTARATESMGHAGTVGSACCGGISRLRHVESRNNPAMVGRGRELEVLAALVAADRPLVAVTGEPGIGKTTLVRTALEASGRPTFEGGAFATLSWMPFLALTRAVGRDVGGGDPAYAAAAVEEAVGSGLLFLDDLHWADRLTLEAVALLRGRVALVVGVRRGTPGAAEALEAVEGAEVVHLEALDEADALGLVRARSPKLGDEAARRVVRSAGGNPLLLEELAAGDGVSGGLRLALQARLRALSPAARDAMSFLALAGRPLERDLLPAGVDELLDAGLAASADGFVGARHALLAETAAEMLDATERARVHGQLADVVVPVGERAQHLAAAGRRAEAYDAARVAAESATSAGERVNHLELAARCAPDDEGSIELRLEAAEALANALMFRELKPVLDSLEPTDPQQRARVELHRSFLALDLGDAAEAERAVDRGLALVGGSTSSTEGLLLSRKGVLEMLAHHRVDSAIELVHAGTRLADDVDRPRALSTQAWVVAGTDAVPQDEWVRWFVAAIDGARAVSNASVELMARHNLCGCLAGSLTPFLARPHVDEALERAAALRLSNWQTSFRWLRAALDLRAGRFADAADACDSALAHPIQEQQRGMLLVDKAVACTALGRFDDAAAALDAFRELSGVRQYDVGKARVTRAELELWRGRPRDAAERAGALLAEARGEHVYVRAQARQIRAWALFELGEEVDAGPGEDAMAEDPIWNEERRSIALLAEDPTSAAVRFAEHAQAFAAMSVRDELRCRWASGEAARRAGDTAGALEHLGEAERRAQEHGMQPLLARVHRSLRLLGERRAAPRSHAGALTAREREILELVGEGLTNSEISRRLGTSVPTVARQIATASRKLGATSRAQAALLAARA